ncbi:50S ribosomal protein L6 [Candidatus Woesebacteria bacterium RIFCSPLOWO2_01_FULL_37_19]|uniref:Large ribosomal subunit protein uL6 n=2 Tax=Candidatus Woeseibacteriota TaxID=1752722 RepID=A0A1F8B282_9BACT|nr:MAG: 50S ribosomal protein L6 [Candidatus Woesebacteria bacterium RIFCSPHIGHO2_01_FULL_38_26b]OGM58111.1 MAG: 50S ribosomal protein L6 [Candidatus Woesebacteria bacterium RIFCSPLOWO2_01_FULL_37_19]
MSKIGKLAIKIPEGVSIEIEGKTLKVTGPKGSLTRNIPKEFEVLNQGAEILIVAKGSGEKMNALHGTTRALTANMVKGVSEGWSKKLELVGTGYRAELSGDTLTLAIGFSHPVKFVAPYGIAFKVEKTDITIEGTDKELVGEVAAKIRAVRPPEPYKGKGIKYKDEFIRRKAGKAAKAVA